MKSFRVIGLMSGTSLDGLDVADVTFDLTDNGNWDFKLNNSSLYIFPPNLLERLKSAFQLPAHNVVELGSDLGRFYAEKVNSFLLEKEVDKSQIDFIASHGQTLFHQPLKG